MSSVELDSVRKCYGNDVAIENVSLSIRSGAFFTMLGPSGCGKSTTLRVVAGLITPDSGKVQVGSRNLTGVPVWRRNIGMMFQSLALFPHMTVAENVAFGLRMRKVAKEEQVKRVRSVLETVRLGHFEDRYPHQMSGGQQQRVALARALVFEPDVLLLDEPFGALDRKLREAMQTEIYHLTRSIGITSLFVTHDQEEALILSDYIAVMNHGKVVQFGSPNEIYEKPRTRFVADFMGASNIFAAKVVGTASESAKLESDGLTFVVPNTGSAPEGAAVEIAIRPEHVELDDASASPVAGASAVGTVVSAIYHGGVSSYEVRLEGRDRVLMAREKNPSGAAGSRLKVGASVLARWAPSAAHMLAR